MKFFLTKKKNSFDKRKGVNLARAQDSDKKRVAKTTDEGAFRKKTIYHFVTKEPKYLKDIILQKIIFPSF